MKKLIDVGGIKDSLLPELLSGVDGGTDASWLKTYEVIDRIENIVNEWVDNQPIVDAEPVRHGHWVRNDNETYSCSECHSWIPEEQHHYAKYCLFCGAKMEEKENETKID